MKNKPQELERLKSHVQAYRFEIVKLEKEIEALENQGRDDDGCTIREGDIYYFVNGSGEIVDYHYDNIQCERFWIDSGNAYKTEQGAENHKLRLLSMKPKYSIKELLNNEHVYAINPDTKDGFSIFKMYPFPSDNFLDLYNLGQIFIAKTEAQEWINTYGPAWVAKDERWLRYEE